MIEQTPFQRLIENLDNLNIVGSLEDKLTYKTCLKNVFSRFDDYFKKHNLYDQLNIDAYVENILKNKKQLQFTVDDEYFYNRNSSGVFIHQKDNDLISIERSFFGQNTTTESILAHEFFHVLSGNLNFVNTSFNNKMIAKNDTISNKNNLFKPEHSIGLKETLTLDNNTFLNEGFTELFTQQLYSENECYKSYVAEVSMVKFLNRFSNQELNFQHYLSGSFSNLEEWFGADNFKKFNSLSNSFLRNNQNSLLTEPYLQNYNYIKLQELAVTTAIKHINENIKNYSIETLLQDLMDIDNYMPTYQPNRFSHLINQTLQNYAVQNKNLSSDETKQFINFANATLLTLKEKENKTLSLNTTPASDIKLTKAGFEIRFKDDSSISYPSMALPTTPGYTINYRKNDKKISISKAPLPENETYMVMLQDNQAVQTFSLKVLSPTNFKVSIHPSKTTNLNTQNIKINLKKRTLNYFDVEKQQEHGLIQYKNLLENFEKRKYLNFLYEKFPNENFSSVIHTNSLDDKEYVFATKNNKTLIFEANNNVLTQITDFKEEKLSVNEALHNEISFDNKTPSFFSNIIIRNNENKICTKIKLTDQESFILYQNELNEPQISQTINKNIAVNLYNTTLYKQSDKHYSLDHTKIITTEKENELTLEKKLF